MWGSRAATFRRWPAARLENKPAGRRYPTVIAIEFPTHGARPSHEVQAGPDAFREGSAIRVNPPRDGGCESFLTVIGPARGGSGARSVRMSLCIWTSFNFNRLTLEATGARRQTERKTDRGDHRSDRIRSSGPLCQRTLRTGGARKIRGEGRRRAQCLRCRHLRFRRPHPAGALTGLQFG